MQQRIRCWSKSAFLEQEWRSVSRCWWQKAHFNCTTPLTPVWYCDIRQSCSSNRRNCSIFLPQLLCAVRKAVVIHISARLYNSHKNMLVYSMTRFECGGILNDSFIANFLPVKEFGKSVENWQSYRPSLMNYFFGTQCTVLQQSNKY